MINNEVNMCDNGLGVDGETHELVLGDSFFQQSGLGYHSIRYDFKPASVDTTREAQLDIGEGHHVTLTVPHVEGSGKPHTVYKGNKKPVSKECVLVIDHDTGTFTLERLTNNITVKKTRTDNYNKGQPIGRPLTPVEQKVKSSPTKVKSSQSPTPYSRPPSPPRVAQPSPPKLAPTLQKESSVLGEISDSSSESDDGSSASDSDSDDNMLGAGHAAAPTTIQPLLPTPTPLNTVPEKPKPFMSIISHDLQLSDSSDDDSD